MTTPTPIPASGIHPVALHIAEQLSQLPPAIQSEVIQAVADLAHHLIAHSSEFEIEMEWLRKNVGGTKERAIEQQYELAMLVHRHVHPNTQVAIHRYRRLIRERLDRRQKRSTRQSPPQKGLHNNKNTSKKIL